MMSTPEIKQYVIDEIMRRLDEKGVDGDPMTRSDFRRTLEAALTVGEPQLIDVPITFGALADIAWFPHHIQGRCQAGVEFVEASLVYDVACDLDIDGNPEDLTDEEAVGLVLGEFERRGWMTERHKDPHSDRMVVVGIPPGTD